jgi:hypothetical protein
MKNISKLKITILSLCGLFLTNCNPQVKKLVTENYLAIRTETIGINKNETATAQKDTYSNYQKFIKTAYSHLELNKSTLLKLQIEFNNRKEKSIIIDRLEIENLKSNHNLLKRQLDEYVQNGVGNWQTFEMEFCKELNELEIGSNNSTIKFIN